MAIPPPGVALFLTELKVSDWSGAVRWYVEVLGLHPVVEDTEHRYALLESGGGRLALKGGGPTEAGRGAVRLVFRVEDVDAARDRLLGLGLGLAVGDPIDNPREGYREVRLCDPEGTPITLFCWHD